MLDSLPQLTVRAATMDDLDELAELERERWGRESGTEVISKAELAEWLRPASPFFLVAHDSQTLVG